MSDPANPNPGSGPATPSASPSATGAEAKNVDIGALLTVALGTPPAQQFADKVGAKLTLMTTVTDMALLLFAAPFSWLRGDEPAPAEPPSQSEST